MTIRKIQPDEHIDILKLRSVSYNSKKDFSDPDKTKQGYELIRALFDDTGKPCATASLEPFTIRFNGRNVNMAGIGAVASRPQERNKGYVRELFRAMFEEMNENNQLFSFLFPFSNPYYRKFGYECGNTKQYVEMPLDAFAGLAYTGRAELMVYDRDIGGIKEIYNAFIKDKNLAVVRTDEQFKRLFDRDPYTELYSTYIWYDESSEPSSYISFDASSEPVNEIHVQELAFKNYDALRGLLGFLNKFHPYFKAFKGYLPGFLDLSLLVAEPAVTHREIKTYGMNRVINAEKVLSCLTYSGGNTGFNIEIADCFIPWNNGVFAVSIEDGETSVKKASGPPDLSCNVQSLTRFATGYTSLQKECVYQIAKVSSKRELLFSLFPQKELFMTESY